MKYMVYAVVALLAAIMFLFLILREKEEPINPSARLESVEKTKRTVTDHANVFHVMLSKSLREFMNARIYVGAFRGNKLLGKQKNGMFYGYTHYFFPALQQDLTDYHKLAVDATYVTGDSQLSGAGFLVKYYINSKMSLQGGPRWNFRDVTISSSKWSLEKVKWIVILSIDL